MRAAPTDVIFRFKYFDLAPGQRETKTTIIEFRCHLLRVIDFLILEAATGFWEILMKTQIKIVSGRILRPLVLFH